jgi:hypothetical protein
MKSHLSKMVSFISVVLFAFSSLIVFFWWLFHPKLDRGIFFFNSFVFLYPQKLSKCLFSY